MGNPLCHRLQIKDQSPRLRTIPEIRLRPGIPSSSFIALIFAHLELLFPYLATVRAGDRATEFKSRCKQLGVEGVSSHSYRYAWAERAKTAGIPERLAMENLGHNSKAVHRAYAKKALVKIPSLQKYEESMRRI
jgi:integrase